MDKYNKFSSATESSAASSLAGSTPNISDDQEDRRLSETCIKLGSQNPVSGGKTLARSPPKGQREGHATPPGPAIKAQRQAPAKRLRKSPESNSSAEASPSPKRKGTVELEKVSKMMSAAHKAISDASAYIFSPESKLNKVQSLKLQAMLDVAIQNIEGLAIQNAFLAGKCAQLEEMESSRTGPQMAPQELAEEVRKAMPSTSPLARTVAEAIKEVRNLVKPQREPAYGPKPKQGPKSYAQTAADTPTQRTDEGPSEDVLTDLGDDEEVQWQQPRRRRKKKRTTPAAETPAAAPAPEKESNIKMKLSKGKRKQITPEELNAEITRTKESEARLILIDLPPAPPEEMITEAPPEGGTSASSNLMKAVKEAIAPRKTGIKIEDLRTTAGGGLAIKASTPEDRQRILELPEFKEQKFVVRHTPQ